FATSVPTADSRETPANRECQRRSAAFSSGSPAICSVDRLTNGDSLLVSHPRRGLTELPVLTSRSAGGLAPMSSSHVDCNLLFGTLALQLDFINRDELIAAIHAWVLDKQKPLGQILVELGTLEPDARSLLDALVQKHLQRHGGDPTRS